MAELRYHPLIKDWVMIASHRQNRPQMPKDYCPFCPGSGKVADHFDVLKYDPSTNRFDMHLRIHDLTYRFVSNTDGTLPTGRPIAGKFQIYGEPISLYLIDGHLWGYFQRDDRSFIIEIFTDDPSNINLSQFQFGLLMEDM